MRLAIFAFAWSDGFFRFRCHGNRAVFLVPIGQIGTFHGRDPQLGMFEIRLGANH